MRFYEKTQIVLSEDTLSEPKQIRFSENFEDVDITLLKESITRHETFPIGVHAISLGNIALGKFLCLKPDFDVEASINGGALQKFRANKVSKLWVELTSLSLTVTTQANEVVVVVAGE